MRTMISKRGKTDTAKGSREDVKHRPKATTIVAKNLGAAADVEADLATLAVV